MLYSVELMRESMDQRPLSLPPPEEDPLEDITAECFFEKVTQAPTQPTKNKRRLRCSRRPIFKRRRRVAYLILVLLLVLVTAGGLLLFLTSAGWTVSEPLERVVTPTVGQALETTIAEDPTLEEEAGEEEPSIEEAKDTEEEEQSLAAPDDPTLYLTVPRLGLYDHTVRNDRSEAALDLGAIKLPYTGFPWQNEDTNTYIACHRLGWPGTESHNQCLNLPSMQKGDLIILKDANGAVYRHRVVETLIVGPDDHWVTDPVAGKDMVSLQTCIESPDDLYTLGPDWSYRFVVRAERTEKVDNFRGLVGDSVTAYTGLLHAHVAHHGGVLQTARKSVGGMVRSLWGSLEPVVPSLLYNRH